MTVIKKHPIVSSIAGALFIFGVVVWITGGFDASPFGIRIVVERANHPFAYMLWVLLFGMIFSKDRLGFTDICSRIGSKKPSSVIPILVAAIVIFELCHFIAPEANLFWNLDSESGLATYYHSFLLFANGVCILSIFDRERSTEKKGAFWWTPILILFWGLSIDELVGFHNGVPRYLQKIGLYEGSIGNGIPEWPILLAPVAIAVVIYFLIFIWKRFRGKGYLIALCFTAVAIWVLAYSAEMLLATSLNHQIQVGLEEGAELLGTSLMLIVFLFFSQKKPPFKVEYLE